MSGHVSRRVRVAAYAVPLCVLPSALWRLHAIFVKDFAPACRGLMGVWEPFYVTSLSVVSLGAALLTVGLIRPWGEVVPGWVPFLGGRVVPVRAAVILAGAGAALIFGVYAYALLNPIFHWRETPDIPRVPHSVGGDERVGGRGMLRVAACLGPSARRGYCRLLPPAYSRQDDTNPGYFSRLIRAA